VKISVCIITYNEEKNIAACIESVKSFSDQILVVDSNSTDDTVSICNKLGAEVIVHPWVGYKNQKQFALDSALHEWVFSIDADERVSKELADKIVNIKKGLYDPKEKAFYVNRRNYYLGKWIKYGGWYPEKRIRFFNRNFCKWGGTDPHDKVIPSDDCPLGDINLDIIHYPYRDISHHIDTINRYSVIAADENLKKGREIYFSQIIYKPIYKFFRDYILKRGFLLGKVGFIHSVMGAFSVFAKYLKTYEKQHLNGERDA